jgi:tartrate dehydrogenase/decarboxylase/D-malate dehydrogenase
MLEHLGEAEAAEAVLAAIGDMLAGDGPRTHDLGGRATTAEVTAALAASFATSPRAASERG